MSFRLTDEKGRHICNRRSRTGGRSQYSLSQIVWKFARKGPSRIPHSRAREVVFYFRDDSGDVANFLHSLRCYSIHAEQARTYRGFFDSCLGNRHRFIKSPRRIRGRFIGELC